MRAGVRRCGCSEPTLRVHTVDESCTGLMVAAIVVEKVRVCTWVAHSQRLRVPLTSSSSAMQGARVMDDAWRRRRPVARYRVDADLDGKIRGLARDVVEALLRWRSEMSE